MPATDIELLREYARDGSEAAFRELVQRHVDLVHGTALRQTGDAQLAEDVTQTVFLVLSQKAKSIPDDTILAGWLFRATRFAASNQRRAATRRERREERAAEMEPSSPSEPKFDQVVPLLDEALEALPAPDRAAILLRFFDRKSIEEVGLTLGTSEGAAKMRVARAVEKLRAIFRQRGVTVPSAVLAGILATQAAHAAPAGLASSVATAALLNGGSTSTLLAAKGTLKLMAYTKAKKLALAALIVLFGGGTAVVVQQIVQRNNASEPSANGGNGFVAPAAQAPLTAPAQVGQTNQTGKVLVFRNVPSWGRMPDFEDVLAELNIEFDVKPSEEMATLDLAPYRLVVIPGAQWRTEFYRNYAANAQRFEQYVAAGGTLVAELNGAERDGISLPGGVLMVKSTSLENSILVPDHPVLTPFGGRPIRANAASHGYLDGVPKGALVLVAEANDGEADSSRPTFVEYAHGKGRVLAACQCFHDRDGSGRGALMPTLLAYAGERKWFAANR